MQTQREDGFESLKKLLPPPASASGSKRAMVLMDPSYEIKSDYLKVSAAIADSLKRFPTGTYLVWYPIIPRPEAHELPARLDAVLRVIYLVFNEGYTATSGPTLTRHDLSSEAIRLGRLLVELLPEPDALGLLALMLLHESRRAARTTDDGEVVLLEEQDRSRWDTALITEGTQLVERSLRTRRVGAYTIQAAIAAVHVNAPTAAATDWAEIAGLYDVLLQLTPSPVVELNRAVAIAMRDGPAAGLGLIDDILARGALKDYRLVHAARADLFRRLGRTADARAAYERALALTKQEPERRFLQRRLDELHAG